NCRDTPGLNVWLKLILLLWVLNDPNEYDASSVVFRVLLVTILITPPKASAPNSIGTTPLYTSIRSAILTGILLSWNAEPIPCIGTPSINTRTFRPVKPLSVMLISDPTPPVSRILTPDARSSILPRSSVELYSDLASSATTLKGDSRTSAIADLPVTSTSSSS